MNPHIDTLLARLLAGEITAQQCSDQIQEAMRAYIDVSGTAKLDPDRRRRTGIPEAIFCPGKTVEQIAAIAERFVELGFTNVIGSQVTGEIAHQVLALIPGTEYHPLPKLLVFNPAAPAALCGSLGIVTAGTSDLPVAEEVRIVSTILGSKTHMIADVGVASIQRLMAHLDELRETNILVVVAGMEGALPSVVAGLVPVPVIALPTSIGYGVNAGGFNALLSNLGSCVPGIMTVNIDNGFGAACAAHKINAAIASAKGTQGNP